MTGKKIIVAIDGYSSCGKSTLARQLAAKIGYNYIDSGAMYRAITLYFLRNQKNYNDHQQVLEALADIHLSFVFNESTKTSDIHLNDEDVSKAVRDMIISDKVSEVAAIREVRVFAVAQQQKMGHKRGIVMDGRDIGSVVFPDAELKIFMTADPAVRVLRRFKEMYATDPHVSMDDVRHNLELRDYLDSTRDESPLHKAADAIVLDNSGMTREEQLAWVMHLINEQSASHSKAALAE